MASNFPTSLDSFTDPTSGSSLASPSHSGQHADLNDAVEKLEAKMGIGSSPATSAANGAYLTANGSGSSSWVNPAWTSIGANPFTAFTVGNGSWFGKYVQLGKVVHVQAGFVMGSTSAVGNPFYMNLPVTAHSTYAGNYHALNGSAICWDFGSYFIPAYGLFFSTTQVYFGYGYDQPPVRFQEIFATGPMTWTTNDRFTCAFTYEAA